MNFIVEVSSRHVHLSQTDADILFGEKGYSLTPDRELSQPGQYLSKEKVSIKKGEKLIERVSILGPVRDFSLVEVSKTDCISMKTQACLRQSGDVDGSESITIIGPKGTVELKQGLIVAMRHIHMNAQEAIDLGVTDKQIVNVAINTEGRKLIFGNVIVRVSPTFALAMHIDTDEANAALVPKGGCEGTIINIEF